MRVRKMQYIIIGNNHLFLHLSGEKNLAKTVKLL